MSRPPEFKTLRATVSTSLTATLGTPRLLRYDHGPHPLEDLPGHVRAASSIRRQGHRLVILQDDVSALAVLDPGTGSTQPILLPAGPGALFAMSLVDGIFLSALVALTGGYDSILYWLFLALIVRGAVSVPRYSRTSSALRSQT